MRLVRPQGQIITLADHYPHMIAICAIGAGLCYQIPMMGKSLEEQTDFVRRRMKANHQTVIEHASMTCMFITDRGVTHEMVRHRLAAYTQESTRYCNYVKDKFGNHVTFVIPPWLPDVMIAGEYSKIEELANMGYSQETLDWASGLLSAEATYMHFINVRKWPAEQARGFLPHFTKTAILWTANMREWRHIFNLRAVGTTGKPHPQMVEVMVPMLEAAKAQFPLFFEGIEV